jgi:hypothetical protein
MRGGTIARVLASKNPKVKEGDFVTTSTGWSEVAIAGEKGFEKAEIPKGGQATDLLGVLGTYFLHVFVYSWFDHWVIMLGRCVGYERNLWWRTMLNPMTHDQEDDSE